MALNVVVPDLVMTFDLPGIPYLEPCFADTKYRYELDPAPSPTNPPYHKLSWWKGLVGVVYEITISDFAHIIATEGGGASYQDILITCHELAPGTDTVPINPATPPFKAHTLYIPPETPGSKYAARTTRPDPNYAQPSARYLELLKTGAHEHKLPAEYIQYLNYIRSYTVTTRRQKMGRAIFTATFLPLAAAWRALAKRLADKDGRLPAWAAKAMLMLFRVMWGSYDGIFKWSFGDGERTIGC